MFSQCQDASWYVLATSKLPLLRSLLLFLHFVLFSLSKLNGTHLTYSRSTDGIPGVAKTSQEFHDFLDRLKIEIQTYGFQPKLNFVFGQKTPNLDSKNRSAMRPQNLCLIKLYTITVTVDPHFLMV